MTRLYVGPEPRGGVSPWIHVAALVLFVAVLVLAVLLSGGHFGS